jgi:hypothetical protein
VGNLHLNFTKSRRSSHLALALLVTALALSGCGGSGKSTTTTAAASQTTTSTSAGRSATTPSKSAGKVPAAPARFSALRECLRKQGVTLPTVRPGQASKGFSRARYEAALKKCGGGLARPGALRAHSPFTSPRFAKALASFAQCMRQHAINIPEPNTSGRGPIFSTKGVNTTSPQFRAAEAKCRPLLLSGLKTKPAPVTKSPSG